MRIGNSEITHDFSKLEKLIKSLKSKHYVDAGILGSGGKTEDGDITIAGIGAVHEFGTDRAGRGNSTTIPKRSVIILSLNHDAKKIQSAVQSRMPAHLEAGQVEKIFEDIGIAAEAAFQDCFDTKGFGTWRGNADSTIARKGSDSPLIDDGTLRNSYASKVGPG